MITTTPRPCAHIDSGSVENLTPHPPHAPELDDQSTNPMLPKDEDPECETHAAAHGLSATLGLVIHGMADGIALGASSLSDNEGLGMIVFLAIIIHKGRFATEGILGSMCGN